MAATRRAALLAALLLAAAVAVAAIEFDDEDELSVRLERDDDREYNYGQQYDKEYDDETDDYGRPVDVFDEPLSMAPAPGPASIDDYFGDYEDGKVGRWTVLKRLFPAESQGKDGSCPEWDEPAMGSDWPFYVGVGDSAYQAEGGATKDKRGPSIWDTFSKWSGLTKDNAHGDVAADFYNKWKDDIKLLKGLGIRTYKFSVSWSRILPKGNGTVNELGLDFYSDLVDELLKNCIEPHVTLYHWDLPFSLQVAYKGFLDYQITDDFAEYADIVFKRLGDRVKMWTTFANPYSFCMTGYGWGTHAPGRCDTCPGGGDITSEPYLCARNVVVGHAKAAEKFRKRVKGGKLGIQLDVDWAEPWDLGNMTHIDATDRHWDLSVRMFADPLYKGRFPQVVRDHISAMPRLTEREVKLLGKARPDFFGMTHYTSNFIKFDPNSPQPMNYTQLKEAKNGTEFGAVAGSSWQGVYPLGLRRALSWVAEEYGDPEIIILECGTSVPGEQRRLYPDVLNDEFRLEYFRGYLQAVKESVKEDDVQVAGFYAWKFLDGFEWSDGYSKRFGITWVNHTSLKRSLKNSAYWLARTANVLPKGKDYEELLHIPDEEAIEEQRDYEDGGRRKATGGSAPVRIDDIMDSLPPALNQPDPATLWEGGRRR